MRMTMNLLVLLLQNLAQRAEKSLAGLDSRG